MPTCRHCGADVSADASDCGDCGNSQPNQVSGGSPNGRGGAGGDPRPGGADRTGGQAGRGRNQVATERPSRRTDDRGGAARNAPPGPSTHPRPTGIRILAALLGVLGLLQVGLGVLSVDFGGGAAGFADAYSGYGGGGLGGGGGVAVSGLAAFVIVFGVGYLAVAAGLWTVRRWAWGAGALLLGLGTTGAFLVALGGATAAVIVGLAINLGGLGLLVFSRRDFVVASRVRHGQVVG